MMRSKKQPPEKEPQRGDGFLAIFDRMFEELVKDTALRNHFVKEIVELVLEELPVIKPGEKGEDGDDGYTPVKGVDYLTEDEVETIVKTIAAKVRPVKGKDYFTKEELEEIKKAAKPVAGVDYPIPKKGDPGKPGLPGLPGLNGSPDTGKEIVDKVNALSIEAQFQIDASHIKNLPKNEAKGVIHRGGIKLVWNTVLQGTVNGSNKVFTLPSSAPTPKDGLFIIETRGVIKSADNNDLTTSNNNRTFTFTSAPPNGSAQPRIILYNGK